MFKKIFGKNLTKNFLLFSFLFIFLLPLISQAAAVDPTPVPGQGWVNEPQSQWIKNVQEDNQSGGVSQESWQLKSGRDYFRGLNLEIGVTGQCEELDLEKCKQKSALGGTTQFIATLYQQPPASGIYYAYSLLEKGGLVKPAYAQVSGLGTTGLQPLLKLWSGFRNLSYIVIMMILVVIGFLIMFRVKIDPKTVISVQNALPGILITLIVITFSYAIAGFLLDLMYFSIALFLTVLAQSGVLGTRIHETLIQLQQMYLTGGILEIFGGSFGAGIGDVKQWVTQLMTMGFVGGAAGIAVGVYTVNPLLGLVAAVLGGGLAQTLLTDFFFGGFHPEASVAQGVADFVSPILLLLVGIGLIFAAIKILLMLITAYVQILLSIVFAPVTLLAGILPGQSPVGGWLKGLIGNVIVFPLTIALFAIGQAITLAIGQGTIGSLWTPPLLTGTSQFVRALIGLGIALNIPTIVGNVRQAFIGRPGLTAGIGPGVITAPIVTPIRMMAPSFMLQAGTGFGGALVKKFIPALREPKREQG